MYRWIDIQIEMDVYMDIYTNRYGCRDGQMYKQINRFIYIEKWIDIQIDGQIDKWIDIQIDGQIYIQIDRMIYINRKCSWIEK